MGDNVHVLNYGGGVNSTAMAIEMVRREMPFLAVFADTGEEHPETYAYVQRFTAWLQERGRTLVIVQSKHGAMYPYMFKRGWIPNTAFRTCTEEWKRRPIRRWLRQFHGAIVVQYIGIDVGERHRAKERAGFRYPLVEWDIDREGCIAIITTAGLPVPVKSGCWFCPFMRQGQWADMVRSQPALFRKAVVLEENSNLTLRSDGSLRQLLAELCTLQTHFDLLLCTESKGQNHEP